MATARVIQAIAITAELCGRVFSPQAAAVFASDLDGYGDDLIIKALARCRRELKGLLTLSDVIMRLDDGRPGIEEAWSMMPFDDNLTVVWTQEMQYAWKCALPLIHADDMMGARMAFKEIYLSQVNLARTQRTGPKWAIKFGRSPISRQEALKSAYLSGRIDKVSYELLGTSNKAAEAFSETKCKRNEENARRLKESLEKLKIRKVK